MSGFRTELETRDTDELAGLFDLLAPLKYYSDMLDAEITVPTGFRSDGNSTPRLPFAYLIVGGRGKKAAVLHDFLYSGGLVDGRALTRKECDQVFAEALRSCGYSELVVGIMYAGVRTGGWYFWNKPNQYQPPQVAAVMADQP